MSDLRILIVDDSVAVRRALTEAIEGEPGMSVCGAAPNGVLALELLARERPDLIVLDLEMPVMDGLEFLSRMRLEHPRLPVLVFSGTAGHANEATLEAMWRGASDYILKPRGLLPDALGPFLRAELFPRIRALAVRAGGPGAGSGRRGLSSGGSVLHGTSGTSGAEPATPGPRSPGTRPTDVGSRPGAEPRAAIPISRSVAGRDPAPSVVLIGASTGGPRALATVLSAMPGDFRLPILVVQHMPAEMTDFFAAGLSFNGSLPVRLAEEDGVVMPGSVWVAPGGSHLRLAADGARVRFLLDHAPEEHGCRPAVDPLFRAGAQVYGSGVIAVVLTGMGHDGLDGARAVHAAQGRVLVQDEESSVVWGMPGAIARAGLAHAILPLAEVGGELIARSRRAANRAEAA